MYDRNLCVTDFILTVWISHVFACKSRKYDTILPNYFIFEDKELSDLISPIWDHENLKGVEKHGGSYWLRINK